MAKSNAGMPRWKDDRITYGGTPEVMADYARKMLQLGVTVIGGCCGSTPEHIAAMRHALDAPPDSSRHEEHGGQPGPGMR